MSREAALPEHVRVAIVGSGFAGLGCAIRLRQSGMEDFVVLERADDLGGTWRDNDYPGCACDVASHMYSFSFAPNPTWTRAYSGQREIWEYMQDCATRFGVRPFLRYGAEVLAAEWDDAARHWRLTTARGDLTADVLVAGTGLLSDPYVPDLPGLASFEGPAFHSARWDHDHDLTGERVAVIGTGASAVQFVPAIQPKVGSLVLFQRTPPWVTPRFDRRISERAKKLYAQRPLAQKAARGLIYGLSELTLRGFNGHGPLAKLLDLGARKHLEKQVPDPVLRAKLTPSYKIGCKRILKSDDYLPSLTQPNVEVVTHAVTEIRPHSVVDAAGVEHAVDTIIFGTGFHVTDQPIASRLRGRDGRLLAEVWGQSPAAYVGTTVPGFPNLFLLAGPNTGIGHTSLVFMIEGQIEYVLGALRHLEVQRLAAVDVRPDVHAAWNAEMDRQLADTVWNSGGCNSWYLDASGRNSTLWPTYTWKFRKKVKQFDPASYDEITPAVSPDRVTGVAR